MAKKKKIKTEIETLKTRAKKASPKEREFLTFFMNQLMLAKEKQNTKEKKRTEIKKPIKPITEKRIAKIEKKLRPSVMKKRKMRKKLKSLTIEEEKIEMPKKREERVKITPRPTPEAIEEAPRYKRILKPLPPLPIPRPPARPPEEEAMAPPTAEIAYPAAPLYPAPEKREEKQSALIALDLGKINLLVKDENISVIQCDGANLPIKVTREGTVNETKIKLSEDEIKEIVQRFADRAGQALSEPIFKTQVGDLKITAIISAFAGSRFVISRI